MSMNDFSRCTPSEFSIAYKVWQEKEQRLERESWELTLFLACCMLQPHSKRKLLPTDICRFSWENQPQDEKEESISTKYRFDEIAKLWDRLDIMNGFYDNHYRIYPRHEAVVLILQLLF